MYSILTSAIDVVCNAFNLIHLGTKQLNDQMVQFFRWTVLILSAIMNKIKMGCHLLQPIFLLLKGWIYLVQSAVQVAPSLETNIFNVLALMVIPVTPLPILI